GYIKWLSPRLDSLKRSLPDLQRELRSKATRDNQHLRVPDIAASLMIGIKSFLDFASNVGAITPEEAQVLEGEAWNALALVSEEQCDFQESENVALRFLELLRAVLVSGRAHLADAKGGGASENPARWGWRERGGGTGDYQRKEWIPLGG